MRYSRRLAHNVHDPMLRALHTELERFGVRHHCPTSYSSALTRSDHVLYMGLEGFRQVAEREVERRIIEHTFHEHPRGHR
eukprot:6090698-Pyramimonas_sp.AAC.1